ncbi:DNA topoisomerase (ATP-hydrolyzing) subunit A [Buchnera aphidicola (Chaitoregma tattakana)]|uniref:DNA topoisomerase (ATP-hydrolyzing) subunit A n=1 Tax=Buchnera aphidicola TaxID=9 RepID=UPI0031B7EC87
MQTDYKDIENVYIEKELKNSYLDYAMSVIIGRALPDVRDGLKPVHRRILFAMNVLKNYYNKPYKKSARIVGDVIGKYHPHGDSAVYEAIVRMAQPFSLRYMLIKGQGNFGSIDGDSAAAMRYTEIKMSKISHEFINDLNKNTVKFVSNYDDTEKIPEILPTKIPNILINGSSGIAVGMATNIPPHNIKEVINGCMKYLENKKISLEDLMKEIPGPDFPTRGIIHGHEGIKKAYETGKGKIYIRAKSFIKKNKKTKKESIIVQEIPYQVNKSKLIEKISNLIKEKKIKGISTLRDESDKEGLRIVIEIKKDAIAEVILNKLYLLSNLQISFGINMVALYNGKPKIMSLKEILNAFLYHRKEIVIRRSIFELKKNYERSNLLEGFEVAINNIDIIIKIIKKSPNMSYAKNILLKKTWKIKKNNFYKMLLEKNIILEDYQEHKKNITNEKYFLTKKQSIAILDLKLQNITNLESKKIHTEYKEILNKIKKLTNIINYKNKLTHVIKKELEHIKKQFGDKRRTKIKHEISKINIEDVITKKDVVVTLSHSGYVKYQPLSDYNAQRRGGRGKLAAKIKEKDFIECLLVTNTHDTILCFSSRGIIYWMKVYQLPISHRNTRGKPIVNLLPLKFNERITAILPVCKYSQNTNIFMATLNGIVKKTSLTKFQKQRNSGIIAINLNKGDELIGVSLTNGSDTVMLFTSQGKVVHFSENYVRKMGRNAAGVRGIKINKKDKVVSLIIPKKHGEILTVTQNGYGKRTKVSEFPIKSRATRGIISIKITKKNGVVIASIQVTKNNEIIMITNSGILVRTRVSEIGVLSRNTQGVILIRTKKQEKVVALQKVTIPKLNKKL